MGHLTFHDRRENILNARAEIEENTSPAATDKSGYRGDWRT